MSGGNGNRAGKARALWEASLESPHQQEINQTLEKTHNSSCAICKQPAHDGPCDFSAVKGSNVGS